MSSSILQAKKNIIVSIVLKLSGIIFPFIIRTMIIKLLGDNYSGLNSLFTSVLQVLSLAELGISSAVVYCLYKPVKENNIDLICAFYNCIRKVYRVIGIAILTIGLALIPFLPYLINGTVPADINLYLLYIIYLSNTVISYFLFAYKDVLLVANRRVDISSIISLVSHSLMYFLQILILFLTKNYYLYIVLLPLFTIINSLIKSFTVKKLFPDIVAKGKITSSEKKELLKMITGLCSYKIGGICRNSFDSIAISAILGLALLTRYSNYYYIVNAVSGMNVVVVNAIIPIIGQNILGKSNKENIQIFYNFSFIFEWITLILTCCLVCLFQQFIVIWVGEDYLFSDLEMLLFVLYFFVLNISDITFCFRQATGVWWNDKFRPVVESITNLLLNFSLVYFFGVVGVVLSTVFTIAVFTIPWGTHVLFNVKFQSSCKKYLITLFVSSMFSIGIIMLCYYICSLLPAYGFGFFVLKMIIGVTVPLLLFPLIHLFDKRETGSINLLKNALRSRKNVK